MTHWQSILSVRPPCPGMESPKSLIFSALLTPEAKKPPKGAMEDAKMAKKTPWITMGLVTKEKSMEDMKDPMKEDKICSAKAGTKSLRRYTAGSKACAYLHSNLSLAKEVLEHVNHSPCEKIRDNGIDRTTVRIPPPKYPSMVFFGDNLISGVLPNIFPAK